MRYFGSYNVEGVARIFVEPEINWVEEDGSGWRFNNTGNIIYINFFEFHLPRKINL